MFTDCCTPAQVVGLTVQAALVVAFEPPDDDPTHTLLTPF
jgi:hypothetical protein